MKLVRALAYLTIATAMVTAAAAQDGWDFDVRGGVNADVDGPFVGAGALVPIGTTHAWYFNPNAEYTAGDHTDVLSVNADFHYDFPTTGSWGVWMGAGPAFVTYDPDFGEDDRNDVGVNFLAGTGAKRGSVRPFVQAKVLASDNSALLVAGGVRW